jgi:hypothetical protein
MEIMAVYSENLTKSINAISGQNADLLNVKAGVKQGYVPLCLKEINNALKII